MQNVVTCLQPQATVRAVTTYSHGKVVVEKDSAREIMIMLWRVVKHWRKNLEIIDI